MPPQKVSKEEIRETVRSFVAGEYLEKEEASTLSDETPLISGGILDSIASVRLVADLEERFGVIFEGSDITVENLNTISKIINLLEKKLRG